MKLLLAFFSLFFLLRGSLGGSLGGESGRRVQYWPVSGRARQAIMSADKTLPLPVAPVMPKAPDGEVEFF